VLISFHSYDRRKLREEGFIWLMLSVCSPWLCSLWVPGKAKHHGGKRIWQSLLTSWQTGSRERRKDCRAGITFKDIPSDLLPPARPHLPKFLELPVAPPTGNQTLTREPLDNTSYSNHTFLRTSNLAVVSFQVNCLFCAFLRTLLRFFLMYLT
jgi:hypothetical protein